MSKYDNPCFVKAADDEPIFVLRANDLLAPLAIAAWCLLAEQNGVRAEKIEDARRVAKDMQTWRAINRKASK